MNGFLNTLIKSALDLRAWSDNFFGPALPWFYGASLIISLLLLWGIIYCVLGSGYINYRVDYYSDLLGVKNVGRRRQLRGWKQILKYLASDNAINWKIAILEADKILDEIFKLSGYVGENEDQRLEQVTPEILSNIDKINEAHKIRNRIAREPDFIINKQEAVEILKIYQQAFQELGLLDQ